MEVNPPAGTIHPIPLSPGVDRAVLHLPIIQEAIPVVLPAPVQWAAVRAVHLVAAVVEVVDQGLHVEAGSF